MIRKRDIEELLEAVKNIKKDLLKERDNEVEFLSKIKIKSSCEHLRTALDYIALDIHSKYYKKDSNIYFPYAQNEEQFKKRLKQKFKNLRGKNIRIYKLMKSVQDFNSSSAWLTTLCKITNKQKHDRLARQQYEKNDKSIDFAGCFHLSGNSKLTFDGCSIMINGQNIIKDDKVPIIISDTMTEEEMMKNINPNLPFNPIKINEENITYVLDETGWDALELIETSLKEIENLMTKVYAIIAKR